RKVAQVLRRLAKSLDVGWGGGAGLQAPDHGCERLERRVVDVAGEADALLLGNGREASDRDAASQLRPAAIGRETVGQQTARSRHEVLYSVSRGGASPVPIGPDRPARVTLAARTPPGTTDGRPGGWSVRAPRGLARSASGRPRPAE